MVRIPFIPEEVDGKYVPYFGKGPYSYKFTDTEELIIQRCVEKITERNKAQKMTPLERFKASYRDLAEFDRVPRSTSPFHQTVCKIIDGWGDTIHPIDLFYHPNLDVVMQFLWQTRFEADVCNPYTPDTGIDMATRRFKMMEWSGPQIIEPFVKTKEDAEWFLDNIPDVEIHGHWHFYPWLIDILAHKLIEPQILVQGSTCAGPLLGAGYLMGFKEFLIGVRKNPELVETCWKAWTELTDRKAEALSRRLVKGKDFMFVCDSIDYVNAKEFKHAVEFTYRPLLKRGVARGWPYTWLPTAPYPDHLTTCCELIKEIGGRSIAFGDEHPTVEEGWEIVHDKYDLNSALIVLSAALNDGPEEKVISEVKRNLKVIAPGFKGALSCIPDYFSKIEWIDAFIWACNEFGKYPIDMSKL